MLFEQCWEGRIVGEDAINRVIGRLRQFAQSDAAGAFRIDTVPRVGYRHIVRDQPEPQAVAAAPFADPAALIPIDPPPVTAPDRRALLVGAGTAAVVAAAGGAYWRWFRPPPPVSPEVAALLARANDAIRRGTPEGMSEALGLFRHIVDIAPDNADAWGGLALVYAITSRLPAKGESNRLLALAAIQKAEALDPHNSFVYGAKSALLPGRGYWLEDETLMREAIRYHPDEDGPRISLANTMAAVGRMKEAADIIDKAAAVATVPSPEVVWFRIQSLWAVNRLQDADRVAVEGIGLYPRQSSVWFSRCHFLMFTARLAEALAFARDVVGRPPGDPDDEFDHLIVVTNALKSRAPADIDKAVKLTLDWAHKGGGFGENALLFLSALGRVDDAFAVAHALYFNRGFTIGLLRFSSVQRAYTQLLDRRTRHLFLPPTRLMRRDPRFLPLVTELGLVKYWRRAGVKPDYQTGAEG